MSNKVSLKGKYTSEQNRAQVILGLKVNEVKFKAAVTQSVLKSDETGVRGVEIGVEKPGQFLIDHELETNVTRFIIHQRAVVASKPVSLTFTHHHGRPNTVLEASAALAPAHKVAVKHNFVKQRPLVRYEYTHAKKTALEQSYDFGAEAWAAALKHKVSATDSLKVAYNDGSKRAEVEWAKVPVDGAPFKVTASVPVGSGKPAFVLLEKEWSFSS
eukprot:jgi/Mesen1/607/ME000108S10768